ncbi:ribose 5-phosphate isomerase A [uncultured Holdemanella sp.]|uniref:ribose 5-phosphate isomerase A n=1 Tax=uncultured Holdemanella sp. TaxID=1763549 RepID=UPI00345DB86F
MKKICAKYASKFIKDGMVVGLGGGSTIQYLIDYVKDKDIQVVTPSVKTALKAQKEGLTVLNTQYVDHVDIAFDGCDEVDFHLNALKSGGGIHTQEKIIASMANEYIVLIDETKFHETLAFKTPVVVEVLPKAYGIVKKKLQLLNGNVVERVSDNKDGIMISDEGNLLLDVYFTDVNDISKLNQTLLMMPGVVDTSLFVDMVTGIIMVNAKGAFKKEGKGEFYAL